MKLDVATIWYQKSLHVLTILLLPVAGLFGLCAAIRRLLFKLRIIKTFRFPVPVIVVGNISVGGTGKTPFVIWLANFLQAQGYTPGIVTRGVGGKKHIKPHCVSVDDVASTVGDEALLLAQNTHCPVVISVDRVAAVTELLKNNKCNIVISDDGLQHYRLSRDIEIVMVDSERGFGNRCLLPAGPLREPVSRLRAVDMVVEHGGNKASQYTMTLLPLECVSVTNPLHKISFDEFVRGNVHAFAGIGHPQRFFTVLQTAGFNLTTHIFPDHYLYKPQDFDFRDALPILMTEKDAVKCAAFADERYWYVRVAAVVNEAVKQTLLTKLTSWENTYGKAIAKDSCCHVNDVQYGNTRR